jgi:DNA-binding phage protein
MNSEKLNENSSLENFGLTEEDLELTDWDAADDFSSTEEMRGFLELSFSDNNIAVTLDAINAVARALGNNLIANQAASLQGTNPSYNIVNQMLNSLGFNWNNRTVWTIL